MLFGCSSCCGSPTGCTPCTKCANKCLKVTLSGFSGGSGCNDCETLNGTYTLTRGNGPQPTVLVATDPPGNATFSVALSKNTNTGTYGIKSVTVDSPGSGYASDVTLTYSILGGTVACDDPPSLTATTAATRREPEISLDVQADFVPPSGTGAILRPNIVPVNTTPGNETWGLGSVTVRGGGWNYEDGTFLKFTTNNTTTLSPAVGSIRIEHFQPSVNQFTFKTTAGSGAQFSPTWSVDQELFDYWTGLDADYDGRWWYISGLAITAGGSKYQAGDTIGCTLSAVNRDGSAANATAISLLTEVTAVDGTGAITAINAALLQPGVARSIYRTTGVIKSVFVDTIGEYYKEEAGISSVTVTNPGTIWPTESLPANCCDGVPVSFCGYSRSEVITCDSGAKCRRIFLTLGELEHTLAVTIDGRRVLRATMPVDEADCTALEFSPGDVTSDCETNGIITVEEGDCSDTPLESCECPSMPAQISLELQGVPNNVFVRNLITGCGPLYAGHWDECGGEPQQIVIWQPYAGGPDYSIPMPPGFVACGDGYSDVRVFQSWKYYPNGHMLPSNGTVILDLAYTEPFACVGSQQGRYIYSGFLPSPPGRFNRVTDCTGGDLSVPVFVELFQHCNGSVTVAIRDSYCYAEIVPVIEGGVVVAANVVSSGQCFAYSQWWGDGSVTVETPTLIVESMSGRGAVLEPVIDTDTASPTFGKIISVTVVNGGSGYGRKVWMASIEIVTPYIRFVNLEHVSGFVPLYGQCPSAVAGNTERISECPGELLDRTYKMSTWQLSATSDSVGDSCYQQSGGPAPNQDVFVFGDAAQTLDLGITCTVSPA